MRNPRKHKLFEARSNAKCAFCENKTEPSYQEVRVLEKYLTERGKIIARSRTGVCSKHQRRLSREIKMARHLSYLPFIVKA